MNILVTGVAGFIGFHLSKHLLNRGNNIIGIDNFDNYYDVKLKKNRVKQLKKYKNFTLIKIDILDWDRLDCVFNDCLIDKVCHLAAKAGVRHSIEYPKEYIFTNIVGFHNVIECSRKYKIKNFVYASSSSIYGNNKNGINREQQKTSKPISLYAATKASNELFAYYYSSMFKLRTTGLRFHTVIGPFGRPDMALHLFADGIANDKPIDVYNNGDMIRDFTYIDDIVNGIAAALDKNCKCEIFNLGSGKKVNLLYYIKCLEKAMGRKAKKNFLPMQPGDVKESLADISRAQKKLGFVPKTNVEKGVREFVKWYKEYYNWKP